PAHRRGGQGGRAGHSRRRRRGRQQPADPRPRQGDAERSAERVRQHVAEARVAARDVELRQLDRGGQERGDEQAARYAPHVQRAFLVGARRKGSAEATQVEEHLEELGQLADTAGAAVVGRTFQRIEAPTPNFYLGQGKVEELKGVLTRIGSTLLLFDEPLSPVQGTNLEQALAVRVMDRTEVILDIFATRARSAEAKMQVELAQLEYLLPRLTRMWTHLSRIRGGIGLR